MVLNKVIRFRSRFEANRFGMERCYVMSCWGTPSSLRGGPTRRRKSTLTNLSSRSGQMISSGYMGGRPSQNRPKSRAKHPQSLPKLSPTPALSLWPPPFEFRRRRSQPKPWRNLPSTSTSLGRTFPRPYPNSARHRLSPVLKSSGQDQLTNKFSKFQKSKI